MLAIAFKYVHLFFNFTKIPGDYVKWFLGNGDNSERETKGKGRKLCLLALELTKHWLISEFALIS